MEALSAGSALVTAAASAPGAAGPVELLAYALSFLVTVVSLGAGIGMFALRLERRDGFWARTALLAGVLVVGASVAAVPSLSAVPSPGAEPVAYPGQLLAFSTILAAAVAVVLWLFHATPWTALFCCTAGYVLQNFASGLTELVWLACGVAETADPTLRGHLVRFALNSVCIAVVYVPFYRVFARHINREGLEGITNRLLLFVMVAVMLGVIGFDLVIKDLADGGLALPYVAALRGFHGLTCVLTYALEYELLVSRRLEVERAATEHVLAERERQYERSRENIEAINVKCHDIRHQIRQLAGGGAAVDPAMLGDIAREVDVYDSTVRTGNEALDTILTEKSLACRRAGVTLSCIADGSALDFMSAADIYAFFGNALDNAIEGVARLGDPQRSSISLVVRRVVGVVSVHVENPCPDDVTMRDGLPVTTKEDRVSHGFGVRSMRLTVERYGGTLTVLAEGGRFHVNAIFPAT